MTPARLRSLASGDGLLIIEGAMGLFDGAPPDGRGAVADLARHLNLPVVLVVDTGRMAGSIAPLVAGFAGFDPDVRVSGVMLNNVGSDRHEAMLRRALAPLGLPVLAALRRNPALAQPSRHLGLVQAAERPDLEQFLDTAADALAATLDRTTLLSLAAPLPEATTAPRMTPPAQVIALARDYAFGFAYPHMLADWRAAGAEIRPFSPLANDPVPEADFIFLPGGYPELHAGQIAANNIFMQSLKSAAQTTDIYGECGGYMVLGEALTDAHGTQHAMAGLLPLETSFATRSLHLGYRTLTATQGPFPGTWAGHEFHYATTLRADGPALFAAKDAEGTALPPMGLHLGRVSGSFAHLIDSA
jgi:cobyrinic acid a,c-diamide synthase